jgi:hypothetical protein
LRGAPVAQSLRASSLRFNAGLRVAIGTDDDCALEGGRKRAADELEKAAGGPAPEGFRKVRVHDLKHTFGPQANQFCSRAWGGYGISVIPAPFAPPVSTHGRCAAPARPVPRDRARSSLARCHPPSWCSRKMTTRTARGGRGICRSRIGRTCLTRGCVGSASSEIDERAEWRSLLRPLIPRPQRRLNDPLRPSLPPCRLVLWLAPLTSQSGPRRNACGAPRVCMRRPIRNGDTRPQSPRQARTQRS